MVPVLIDVGCWVPVMLRVDPTEMHGPDGTDADREHLALGGSNLGIVVDKSNHISSTY